MLSLHLKSGEYLTIGDDIVVQVFQVGQGVRVAVQAPRETPIVRGEVRERTEPRPEGLYQKSPKSPAKRKRDAKRDFKRSAQTE